MNVQIRSFLVTIFTVLACSCAIAGRPGSEYYQPVKSMNEAKTIKSGEMLAISCGKCGTLTTFPAPKSRSYLEGYTCDTCRTIFTTVGNPKGGAVTYFRYEDKAGHKSHLLRGLNVPGLRG